MNIKAVKRLSNVYTKLGYLNQAKFYLESLFNKVNNSIVSNKDENIIKNKSENIIAEDNCTSSTNNNMLESLSIKKELDIINHLNNIEEKIKTYVYNKDYKNALVKSSELLVKCPCYTQLKLIHAENLINNDNMQEASKYLKSNLSEQEKVMNEFIFLSCRINYYEGNFDKSKAIITTLISKINKFLSNNLNDNSQTISNTQKCDLLKSLNSEIILYSVFKEVLERIEQIKETAKKLFIDEKYFSAIEEYKSLLNIVYPKDINSLSDLLNKSIEEKYNKFSSESNDSTNLLSEIKININHYIKNKYLISTIYTNIAFCLQKQCHLSEALNYTNLAININSKYAKAFYRKGSILFELSNFDDAYNNYKEAYNLDSSFKDAKFKMEEIEMEKEKFKKRKDYYRILDISPSANENEIRQSYRKLAAKWHPDKNNVNEKRLIIAKKMFEDISEAYNVLSNPSKKKAYDSGREDFLNFGSEAFSYRTQSDDHYSNSNLDHLNAKNSFKYTSNNKSYQNGFSKDNNFNKNYKSNYNNTYNNKHANNINKKEKDNINNSDEDSDYMYKRAEDIYYKNKFN